MTTQLGTPTATSEAQWFAGVSQNPDPNIITHDILVAGGNKILWYWTFPQVASAKYRVTGFNLFHINNHLQIYEADMYVPRLSCILN
jgi:hypothetical protein